MFHNTGANAFAKNQMRLAYEDKRDLYCTYTCNISWIFMSYVFLNFICKMDIKELFDNTDLSFIFQTNKS